MVTSIPNVSYLLLDLPVIEGRADDPVVTVQQRTWSHARLLEEVAAMAGVLRHLGVTAGEPVRLALGEQHHLEAVVAALAVARLGGVVTTEGEAPVVVASRGTEVPAGRARLVRSDAGQDPVAEPDLDWSVMLRAGRTDPAPCEVLAADAAYAPGVTVSGQLESLGELPTPLAVAELRRALRA